MSEGPIPWLAVDSYCNTNGIEGEQREDLEHHIRALDTAYLDYRAKQAEKKD
jgi:hypothetical protein